MSPDDVIVWPCGTWCYRHELHEFGHKSDDYEVLPAGSERATALASVGEAIDLAATRTRPFPRATTVRASTGNVTVSPGVSTDCACCGGPILAGGVEVRHESSGHRACYHRECLNSHRGNGVGM